MEREEGQGRRRGELREGREEWEGKSGRTQRREEEERERLQPLQGHNHPVHLVLPWESVRGVLSQHPFLEQVIACGLKAFHPRLLEVEPQPQSPAKRTLNGIAGWGRGWKGELSHCLGFSTF